MNIDIAGIVSRIDAALAVTRRSAEVIQNAQSQKWPYAHIDHPTRIFCAIMAAQGREMAERATKQVGIDLKDAAGDDRTDKITAFFAESANWTGTDRDSMAAARIAAQEALLKIAQGMVARAERVLEGEETFDGRPIAHGALWYK